MCRLYARRCGVLSMNNLKQDRTQTELYLSLLDGKDTPYTFQVFDDNKDRSDRSMARVIEGTLNENWKLLTDLNDQGAGIFITVNRGKGGRKRENIKSVRSIFIEDDTKAGVARPDLPIRPSFIVNSSDGNYHHYFKVDDMPLSLFEPTQNRLIADYHSDKAVKDLSRVLRLPGFFHQKAAPYLVNLVDDKSLINPVAYTCEQIEKAFPPLADSSGSRAELATVENGTDPVLNALSGAGLYLSAKRGEKGVHFITCPWSNEHTSYSGVTESALYLPRTGGYEGYGYQCQHSHCADRTAKDLIAFLDVSLDVAVDKAKTVVVNDLERYQRSISRCESRQDLMSKVVPEIIAANLQPIELGLLEAPIQKQILLLEGAKPTIKAVRTLLNPLRTVGAVADKPRWCRDWVYVSDRSRYVKLSTLVLHDRTGFDLENTIHVPADENGFKMPASVFVRDNALIDVVDTMMYDPTQEDRVCMVGERRIVNTFNINSVPVANEEYVDRSKIKMIEDHLDRLVGKEQAEILINYLACCVQRQGKIIGWCPVIIGSEGVGKTFISRMMATVLGENNTNVIGTEILNSNFNSYAVNQVFTTIEELRVRGTQRHQILNTIKPLITNKVISINLKGVTTSLAINTTSYLCLSNHKDAIPVGDDDRRFFIVYCNPLEVILDGKSRSAYFDPLFETLDEAGDIRKWLTEYPLSDAFKAMKSAPISDSKLSAIATERSVNGAEGYFEASELIRGDIEGINKYAFCSKIMRSELIKSVDVFKFVPPTDRAINLLFKELGYFQFHNPVRVLGELHRVWIKNPMTLDQIKECLE